MFNSEQLSGTQRRSLKLICGIRISKRDTFDLSGPRDLAFIDWNNVHHQRSVAACLVKGVYVLERDRQKKRKDQQALSPPWWEYFNFQLWRKLIDDVDSSVFGAIFEYKPPSSSFNHSGDGPHFVVAFRGTMTEIGSVCQDFSLNIHLINHGLPLTSRFQTAMQEVQYMVTKAGHSRVWLAGHSSGSAIALLAGKNMAERGLFLKSFLFNPPYVSLPIEKIKSRKVKDAIRFTKSVIKAALAINDPQLRSQSAESFLALSAWFPQLYVNAVDDICSEYIGYFEHRNKMEESGLGPIEKLATRYSLKYLLTSAKGRPAVPLHLIPSAIVTININPPKKLNRAHGIHNWWRNDLKLEVEVYMYP